MTDSVHQTPDNFMTIIQGTKVYTDTKANFELDFLTTVPALPSGVNDRYYEVGIRHPLMGGGNVIDGGPMPWPLGDTWIANIDVGLANQAVRNPPVP